MPDVHLVTTARFDRPAVIDAELTPLIEACAAVGIEARAVAWHDAAVDWAAAPLTVIRTPWDYPTHLGAFLDWAAGAAAVTQLLNPVEVLRWNVHKRYLPELAAAGFDVVPSTLVGPGHDWSVPEADRYVVKLAVGSGARGAERGAANDAAFIARVRARAETQELVVSAYADAIETAGEVSTVFIDGNAVHAVRKIPAAGDYRIHEQYGGQASSTEPGDDGGLLAHVAERFGLEQPLLYARLDTVEFDGRPHLMELELVEPAFYLPEAPATAAVFADALVGRAETAR